MSAAKHMPVPILPLYYVRHPDGSYSVAQPQPTPEQVVQQDGTYSMCDGKHGGSACADPHCYLPRVNAHYELAAQRDELLAALQKLAAAYERLKPPGSPKADAEKQAFAAIAKCAPSAAPAADAPCRVNPMYAGPSQCSNGTVGCTIKHLQADDMEGGAT